MSREKLTAIGSIEVGCLVRVATDDPPAELMTFNAGELRALEAAMTPPPCNCAHVEYASAGEIADAVVDLIVGAAEC